MGNKLAPPVQETTGYIYTCQRCEKLWPGRKLEPLKKKGMIDHPRFCPYCKNPGWAKIRIDRRK